jgi:hypothetical protein
LPVRRSASAALVAALVALGGTACRHALPPPADWSPLVGAARSFSGLYRASCCGGRRFTAAVRSDGERLLLSVSVRPRGVVFEAWIAPTGAWAAEAPWSCRWPLESGRLPLGDRAALPIDPALLAVLLAGRLPEGAVALEGAPGWVEVVTGSDWLRGRVSGAPARLVRVEAGAAGLPAEVIAELDRHHGTVPGTIAVEAAGERLRLELVEWRPGSQAVPEPAWLAAPACAEGS